MVRARIIYPSMAPWVNGVLLHRVQTIGTDTTFNSEDLFELGSQEIVDVVDDIPAVAVTIDTNDYGSVDTVATLAGIDITNFGVTADNSNAYLVVASGNTEVAYLHGANLLAFARGTCDGTTGIDFWSPVQEECDVGTTANNIEFTQYLSRIYINRIDMSYNVRGNATENYAGETDFKLWLLNDGRFVSYEKFTFTGSASSVDLALNEGGSPAEAVVTLSDSSVGFMRIDPNGDRAVTFYDSSAGTVHYWPVVAGTVARVNYAVYNSANNNLLFPTAFTVASGDTLELIYAANAPADESAAGANRVVRSHYYEAADAKLAGGLRKGQIEAYIVDPLTTTDWSRALRLQSVNISATLTREQLMELGRLRAYDRPATVPIPITVTVETTAADLEQWAIFAGKLDEYTNNTLDDIDIFDLMNKKDSILVIKVYRQTDEDAGGTGSSRKVLTDDLLGEDYFNNGTKGTYASTVQPTPEQEYALKTIIVPGLAITSEAFNLAVGNNATQTFNFRARNELTWIKGDIDFDYLLLDPGIVKNT